MRHAHEGFGNGELDTAIAVGQSEAVLAVLEPDQLVAAKESTRFGRRRLARGMRALLWGLRLYVLFMVALVLVQVIMAVHGGGH